MTQRTSIQRLTDGMAMERINGFKVYTARHAKTGDVRVVIVDGWFIEMFARFADEQAARTEVHNRVRAAG